MALLSAVSLAVFGAGDGQAGSRDDIKEIVVRKATAARIPPSLALAVAKVESDFQVRALGPNGTRGVMQVLPETAEKDFGIDRDDLWNASTNIQVGVALLARLIRRYDGNRELALSHYKAGGVLGEGATATPQPASRSYIASVLRWQHLYAAQARVWRTLKSRSAVLRYADNAETATSGRRPEHPAERGIRPNRHAVDDFGASIEHRRQRIAPRLDDLTPVRTAGEN
jgi:hypothetical protein